MTQPSSPDYTQRLRSRMEPVGISSFKALGQASGVSKRQISQLRQGHAAQMQVEPLHKLSQVLQISLVELIVTFSDLPLESPPVSSSGEADTHTLKQEYQRLQLQLEEQQERLQQAFQQSSIQILESLLLQLPTAAYAVQQNPEVPATRILPLLGPIDQLLQSWGIEPIAPVGSEVAYDPQSHQLMEGTAEAGDRVKVRYTGYRQGDRLLYRAKVSRA